MIYTEGSDAYLIFNSMGSKPPVPAHERFTYITKLNDAWDDIETGSLANTSAVMEGLWLFKRRGRYFLFGSHLSGYAPNGERKTACERHLDGLRFSHRMRDVSQTISI